jgi:hypothetical protein
MDDITEPLPPLRAVIQHEVAVVDQPPEGKR